MLYQRLTKENKSINTSHFLSLCTHRDVERHGYKQREKKHVIHASLYAINEQITPSYPTLKTRQHKTDTRNNSKLLKPLHH